MDCVDLAGFLYRFRSTLTLPLTTLAVRDMEADIFYGAEMALQRCHSTLLALSFHIKTMRAWNNEGDAIIKMCMCRLFFIILDLLMLALGELGQRIPPLPNLRTLSLVLEMNNKYDTKLAGKENSEEVCVTNTFSEHHLDRSLAVLSLLASILKQTSTSADKSPLSRSKHLENVELVFKGIEPFCVNDLISRLYKQSWAKLEQYIPILGIRMRISLQFISPVTQGKWEDQVEGWERRVRRMLPRLSERGALEFEVLCSVL